VVVEHMRAEPVDPGQPTPRLALTDTWLQQDAAATAHLANHMRVHAPRPCRSKQRRAQSSRRLQARRRAVAVVEEGAAGRQVGGVRECRVCVPRMSPDAHYIHAQNSAEAPHLSRKEKLLLHSHLVTVELTHPASTAA